MALSQQQGDKKSGLRRYTFVLSAEFSLEREIIAHLQQLGQYRTTDALRRFALRGFQWRAAAPRGQGRPTAAPAWSGEAPQSLESSKKRCWMYLSTRVSAESNLSQLLEPIGADRRAQIIRDLVIDGFWLEKNGAAAISELPCASESIAWNMPEKPSATPRSVDNGSRQMTPDRQAQVASSPMDAFQGHVETIIPEPAKVSPQELQAVTGAEVNGSGATGSGTLSEPMLVQGAPMQRKAGSVPTQASALSALMGGVRFTKKQGAEEKSG